MRALLILGLLLIVPAAQACGQQVTPIVGLEFDGKAPCMFTATGEFDGCEPLPELGESRTYEGRVKWYWDADQCSVSGGYLQGDMQFAFSSSDLSPKWLPAVFEPATITVPLEEYYTPTEFQFDSAQNRIYSEQTRPVSVTFTFDRLPTEGEQKQLQDRDDAARVFLKVLATGTGTGDAFGITQFIFNADEISSASMSGEEPANVEAPGVPVAMLLAVLAIALMRRRK